MSDKGYYYTKISACEREIEVCSNAIRKKNHEVSELSSLKSRVISYLDRVDEVQRNRRNSLSLAVGDLCSRKRYSQKIIQSYEQSMSDLLSGSDYYTVVDGMLTAEEIIKEKIRRLNEEIEEHSREISKYNSNIEKYRREIQRIEEREREYGRYDY